ncbi:hypothetical protein [Endozoicomonas sp. ONNA2]|uniref:hypothetical protein n=1 Tax=Endozoicomonas sp. ONNA2 TaxID=2828741 RepID=UPI00214770EF|nr:hypothetical protein [Endozoicomonas sp. ONNA2]
MNPHEYPIEAAININSWQNNMNMNDKLLINGVGEFKGDEKEVIFYSVEAKRYYNVSICASSNIDKFVNVIVTAQTGRKNIISRMVGAIADAFKRLNISGMKFSKTRSFQIKNKLENDILNLAIANGNKQNADKKTIENGRAIESALRSFQSRLI